MTEPQELDCGTVMIHKSGGIAVLDQRKDEDDGWWVLGGGGLADRVIADGDWVVFTEAIAAHVFGVIREVSHG